VHRQVSLLSDMSCSTNKSTATDNFNAASYSSSGSSIQLLEETQSSNNTCTLTSVRGKVRIDLTSYTTGTCTVYFKVSAQSGGSSNSPPVTANGTYKSALSATMGIVNTSSYYANSTPTFDGANDCSTADKQLGWILSDQVGAVQPRFRYHV